MTAVVVYGIDSLYDWLSENSTEHLEAQIAVLDANAEIGQRLAHLLESQYQNSLQYKVCIANYDRIQTNIASSALQLQFSLANGKQAITNREDTISNMQAHLPELRQMDEELIALLKGDPLGESEEIHE